MDYEPSRTRELSAVLLVRRSAPAVPASRGANGPFFVQALFPRRQIGNSNANKNTYVCPSAAHTQTTNWPCMHHVLGFSYIHAFTVWVLRHTLRESAVRPCYDLYNPLSLRFSVGRADTSPHPSHIKQSSETPHTRAISVAIFFGFPLSPVCFIYPRALHSWVSPSFLEGEEPFSLSMCDCVVLMRQRSHARSQMFYPSSLPLTCFIHTTPAACFNSLEDWDLLDII